MVKDIYRWKFSDNNEKVVAKHFSELIIEDMMTYIKSPLKHSLDCFIIHVGTNNFRIDQHPEIIARNIVEVANNSKTDTRKVLIPSIVPRRNNLNGKGRQVSMFFKKFCMENVFVNVNHDNIKTWQHCNYNGIHLNTLASKTLADNFILALNRVT